MFDRLDFVYLPSRDIAADLKHFTGGLGAEVVFAIEAFGTRVAMVRLALDPPPLLFAGPFRMVARDTFPNSLFPVRSAWALSARPQRDEKTVICREII